MDLEPTMEPEEARRRLKTPGVQRRLGKIRDRYWQEWEETTMPASEVFGIRLGEMRRARGLSLDKLAELMAWGGFPISRGRLHALEHNGRKRLSLDEALALADKLDAILAHMLTPPEEQLVRLSGGRAVGGEQLRKWLVSGLPHQQRPAASPEDDERADADREIARLALNFVDAMALGNEGRTSKEAAFRELRREVNAQRRPRG